MAKIDRESINFKLPKTLTAALRAKARQLNTTATDLVILGLHHVLGQVPGTESSIETRIHQLETQLNHISNSIDKRVENGVEDGSKQKLEALEQKIEAIALQIAQMEGAIAVLGQRQQTGFTRRQPFNYHPPQIELQPYSEENLAKRLGVDPKTLALEHSSLSASEFERWCRSKDPRSMAWRLDSDGLYHPVK